MSLYDARHSLMVAVTAVLHSAGFLRGEAEPTLRELRVGIAELRALRAALADALEEDEARGRIDRRLWLVARGVVADARARRGRKEDDR